MKTLVGFALAALSLSAAGIEGSQIHWATVGKGDKVVVFIPGWTCDSTTWARQVPVIARTYRVITIDLPGHGLSTVTRTGNYSMDLFAKSIEAVRREAQVDQITLVGHSMGAPVIRQYARLYPQHVRALVLVDGTVIDVKTAAGFAAIPDQFKGPDAAKNRVEFIHSMFTPATTPELRVKIEKMMTKPADAVAAGAMAAMADPAIWKEEAISMPVLGIYADHSRLGNRELLSKIYPSIEYIEIPGTDHFLMLEKPAEFNRLLTAFLEKLP